MLTVIRSFKEQEQILPYVVVEDADTGLTTRERIRAEDSDPYCAARARAQDRLAVLVVQNRQEAPAEVIDSVEAPPPGPPTLRGLAGHLVSRWFEEGRLSARFGNAQLEELFALFPEENL
jgi:hypothetical protein